jgi:hypothetical protein
MAAMSNRNKLDGIIVKFVTYIDEAGNTGINQYRYGEYYSAQIRD